MGQLSQVIDTTVKNKIMVLNLIGNRSLGALKHEMPIKNYFKNMIANMVEDLKKQEQPVLGARVDADLIERIQNSNAYNMIHLISSLHIMEVA